MGENSSWSWRDTERQRLDVLLRHVHLAMAQFAGELLERVALFKVHGAEGVAERMR